IAASVSRQAVAVVAGLKAGDDAVAAARGGARLAGGGAVPARQQRATGSIAAVAVVAVAVVAGFGSLHRAVATLIEIAIGPGRAADVARFLLAVGVAAVTARGVTVVAGLAMGDLAVATVGTG